jgi:predicted tellurium resistance membrane protein TerC
MDLTFLSSPETWIALLTLTSLEIVLGIDNIVFISIMAGKLPPEQRRQAYVLGLAGAMIMRIALLFSISFIVGLTAPLFTLPIVDRDVSGRDLILFGGGLFLITKATFEIHERLEGAESGPSTTRAAATLGRVVVQIMLLDIVFSLDSVITAVGMARDLSVMVAAVVIAVLVMMFAARPIGELVDRHPSLKMLALSFLLLIGTALVAEAAHVEIPKGYIYFAMGFSVVVEVLNIRAHARAIPVHLRDAYVKERESDSPPGPA